MAEYATVDWESIAHEYITGKASHAALAKKYNVSRTMVSRMAARDKWTERRAKYRLSVVDKASARAATKQAAELASVIDATVSVAKQVAKILTDDPDQLHRHLVQEGVAPGVYTTEERVYQSINTGAVRDLVQAIKGLDSLIREYAGIPTMAQRENQRIAAERLELERRRVDINAVTDNVIEVVIGGDSPEDYGK